SSCCFLFSSRRRHTRSKRDWSSDVCSSDLIGEFYAFYKKLGQLKGNHPALAGGKHPASFTIINSTTPKKLTSSKRAKKGEEILYIANITADSLSTTVAADGEFINYITGNTIKLQHTKQLQLAPCEYLILIRQ